MNPTLPTNVFDWLRQEAHVVADTPPFRLEKRSCLPLVSETTSPDNAAASPAGFLVANGTEISYVAAETPDGEQMAAAWHKRQIWEIEMLPSECWVG